MKLPQSCPKCASEFNVGPEREQIPSLEERQYTNRVVGIVDFETMKTTHWHCPDCGWEWKA